MSCDFISFILFYFILWKTQKRANMFTYIDGKMGWVQWVTIQKDLLKFSLRMIFEHLDHQRYLPWFCLRSFQKFHSQNLPPLHIKLSLFKNFVKFLDPTSEAMDKNVLWLNEWRMLDALTSCDSLIALSLQEAVMHCRWWESNSGRAQAYVNRLFSKQMWISRKLDVYIY